MPQGSNTVQVEYKLLQAPQGTATVLEVRPLIAFRDYHSTTHENGAFNREMDIRPIFCQPAAICRDFRDSILRTMRTHLQDQGYWYKNLSLSRGTGTRPGLSGRSVQSICAFMEAKHKQGATMIASTEQKDIRQAAAVRAAELQRRQELVASSPVDDPLFAR